MTVDKKSDAMATMSDPTTHRPCPACDSADSTMIGAYSPAQWQIAQCDRCDFVFLRNPPEYEALEEEFAWEKTYAAKKKARRGSTWFSPIGRWLKQKTGYYGRNRSGQYRRWFRDGKVLDIGCGNGGRIAPPMTPFGIELSNALHAQADEKMRLRNGYCVHGPGAEAIWEFPEAHFDGIIMNSYLEHEVAVMKVLSGAARCLKDDGHIYIRVPNFASLNRRVIGKTWCGFRYPDHVNYFTLQSLRDVASKAGFDLKLINTITLPIDDNIQVLLSKKSPQKA